MVPDVVDPATFVVLPDVRIEPAWRPGLISGGIVIGGDAPEWVSTMRSGVPYLEPVERSARPETALVGEYIWGGVAVHQPGHFVAEQTPRLVLALRAEPDMPVLFQLRHGTTPGDLPTWFWDVIEYLGAARDRVEFVQDAPVRVERLRVYPQAEHLTKVLDDKPDAPGVDAGIPSSTYLDALGDIARARGIVPVTNDVVYVSRAGMPTGFAGETYLESLLTAAGVAVIRPEDHPLGTQLEVFAGADHLVFAEGSALHFRQLLGVLPQTITVLQRRVGNQVARRQLEPRVNALEYVPVVRGQALAPYVVETGVPYGHTGIALVDRDRLVGVFARAGVDLASAWDDDDFAAAQHADLLQWAHYVTPLSRKRMDSLRYAVNAIVSLTALGYDPVLTRAVAEAIQNQTSPASLQDITPVATERDNARAELARLREEIVRLRTQLSTLERSHSLRLGRALLSPAIFVKKHLSR
jgi:hypothetical protein